MLTRNLESSKLCSSSSNVRKEEPKIIEINGKEEVWAAAFLDDGRHIGWRGREDPTLASEKGPPKLTCQRVATAIPKVTEAHALAALVQ